MIVMERKEIVFLNSVCFVIGFTIVFSIVGIAIESLLSSTAMSLMNDLRIIGGALIIIFGILIVLSVKYYIPFFTGEYRLHIKRLRNSYLSSLVFGIAFAIGWTPCVGPILGAIYALALSSPALGFLLLLSYSLGIGIPFLIAGAFISKWSVLLKKASRFLRYFNAVSGSLLVVLGILVVTGYIGELSIFLFGANFVVPTGTQLNFLIALFAGVITFFSPCILPLIPAYFSYLAGTAASEAKR
jgi:cytochrome c-type biogenesis protein